MIEITEVRIKLMEDNSGSNDLLRAFATVVIGGAFAVRDLKIIEGAKGFFVAMPSRKLADRCHDCGTKNHLLCRFCNQCGRRLGRGRARQDAGGRDKLHADVAHPITGECREYIHDCVVEAYHDELELSRRAGYVSRYEEYDGIHDGYGARKAV